jgi:uncharacterized protein (TIGR03083 family)
MAGDIWPTIRAERTALAADLAGLSQDRWGTPSLCSEWSVRNVLAHMTATARITPGTFFPKLVGAGFKLRRLQAKDIAAESQGPPSDTLARFESVVDSKKHPPGPVDTMLGETIVHAEDIRRPLGMVHEYPTAAVVRVADFYKGSNLILGTKRRISGICLRAADADWTHGTGPEVTGPMLSLLLAMVGRKAPLADLSGPGVDVLRGRP